MTEPTPPTAVVTRATWQSVCADCGKPIHAAQTVCADCNGGTAVVQSNHLKVATSDEENRHD